MDKTVKSGMTSIFGANIINLFFGLITSFMLPKFLSVDTYADVKTFQLYVTYIGLMHLGYVDGMYLKYGGKLLSELSLADLKEDLSTMRIFQLAVSILGVIAGLLLEDKIFVAFALSILPQNMIAYFKYLYQSVGEFKKYGRILNHMTAGMFAVNVLLIFFVKTDDHMVFALSYVLIYVVIWGLLELQVRKNLAVKVPFLRFSFAHLKTNISSGIFLMFGTFSSIILTGMDRWFVKGFMDNTAFAQYSFAVSMQNFMNITVTPVTITLYNYFCRNKDTLNYNVIKKYVTIFAAFIVSAAFPAKFVLEVFLPEYLGSVKVMFLLFGAQIFFIIVKAIHVNLYKIHRMQSRYFLKLLSVICVGIVFNIVCFRYYPHKEAFALGTLLAAIYWFFISVPDFKSVYIGIKGILYPFAVVIVYIICGICFQAVAGFFLYLLSICLLTFLFYRKTIQTILHRKKQP